MGFPISSDKIDAIFTILLLPIAIWLFVSAVSLRKKQFNVLSEKMKEFASLNNYTYKKNENNNQIINKSRLFKIKWWRMFVAGELPAALNYIEGVRNDFKIAVFNCLSPEQQTYSYVTGMLVLCNHNLSEMIINSDDSLNLEHFHFPALAPLESRISRKIPISGSFNIYAIDKNYKQNSIDKIIFFKDILFKIPLKYYQIEMLNGGLLLYFPEFPKSAEHLNEVLDKFIEFTENIKS